MSVISMSCVLLFSVINVSGILCLLKLLHCVWNTVTLHKLMCVWIVYSCLCVSSGCHAGSQRLYWRWIWAALWGELCRPLPVDLATLGYTEGFWEMWSLLSRSQRLLLCPPHQQYHTKWLKQLVSLTLMHTRANSIMSILKDLFPANNQW